MRWSWKDGSKLQRKNSNGSVKIPKFDVPSAERGKPCGTVTITASIDANGTRIEFKFTPAKQPPKGCCEKYGWIQHVTVAGGWRYDNGAAGSSTVTGAGWGAPSDPSKDPQGSDEGERWKDNPWYGGPGNVTDEKKKEINEELKGKKKKKERQNALDRFGQEWPRKPEPQSTIRDHPGGVDGFVTQLVCVETGKVVFQYRWVQYRERGETQFRFVGAAGTNLTISP